MYDEYGNVSRGTALACKQFIAATDLRLGTLVYKCSYGRIQDASQPCKCSATSAVNQYQGRSISKMMEEAEAMHDPFQILPIKTMTPEQELVVDAMIQNEEDLDTMALILSNPIEHERNPAARYLHFRKVRKEIEEYLDTK